MIFSFLATAILFACSSNSLPMRARVDAEHGDGEVGTQVNNGIIVEKGTYPFMTYVSNCGASLVAPNVLLSAAHCDSDSFGFETDDGERVVYVGLHDWRNDTEGVDYEEIAIEEKVLHPAYDDFTLDYDYMVVKLKTNSTFTPVALDDGSLRIEKDMNLTMMGWGRTGYYDNYCDEIDRDDEYYNTIDHCWPFHLLEGQNVFSPRRKCNKFYDDLYEEYYSDGRPEGGWISPRMMCSLDENADGVNDIFTGKGDSGGPLIHTETQTQIGIVSWGGDPSEKAPNVYAFVRSQYKWINGYIEDWNFEMKTCRDMNHEGPCKKKEGCIWKKKKCKDALTTEECSEWDGKRRVCRRKGCLWKKRTKSCLGKWG